eukprot:c26809_g1_i1 orf=549-740(-)
MVRTYTFAAMVGVAIFAVSHLDDVFDWMAERKERKMKQLEMDLEAAKLRRELLAEIRKKELLT